MDEIWTDIEGFEGYYQVSNLGRIKALPRTWSTGNNNTLSHNGKILKATLSKPNGYLTVILYKNGIRTRARVHHMVAKYFVTKPESTEPLVLDHINGNKEDNRADNLRWVTHFENSCCNINTPTTNAKPILQYSLDGDFINEFKSINEAASQLNLNQANITHCLKGRYKHSGGFVWRYK